MLVASVQARPAADVLLQQALSVSAADQRAVARQHQHRPRQTLGSSWRQTITA